MEPLDDPPFNPDAAPHDGDERAVTSWLLDYQRWVFLRKLDGLSEEQSRRTLAPSDLTLLGLARHMAGVEQYWFGHVLRGIVGTEEAPLWEDEDDPDRDFHITPEDTLAEAVAALHQQIRAARSVTAAESFDAIGAVQRHGGDVNLRWIVVHMIEEYARHLGHADLIRQSIDGATGD